MAAAVRDAGREGRKVVLVSTSKSGAEVALALSRVLAAEEEALSVVAWLKRCRVIGPGEPACSKTFRACRHHAGNQAAGSDRMSADDHHRLDETTQRLSDASRAQVAASREQVASARAHVGEAKGRLDRARNRLQAVWLRLALLRRGERQ
jgi:hypothetical protein